MKKSKDEEFPFAYLSFEQEKEPVLAPKSNAIKREKTETPRTISGQIQILSLISLALLALLLILLFTTFWVFDMRQTGENVPEETAQPANVVYTESVIVTTENGEE